MERKKKRKSTAVYVISHWSLRLACMSDLTRFISNYIGLPVSGQRLEINDTAMCIKRQSNNAVHECETLTQNARLRKVRIGKHGRMCEAPSQIASAVVYDNCCKIKIIQLNFDYRITHFNVASYLARRCRWYKWKRRHNCSMVTMSLRRWPYSWTAIRHESLHVESRCWKKNIQISLLLLPSFRQFSLKNSYSPTHNLVRVQIEN